jgi:tRNA threonylcarbamoyladenosine biosynthesis protein TsaB
MRVLACDTAASVGSLALVEEDCVLEEIRLESSDGFAHILFGEIQALLARHCWSLPDVDLFAGASGPGSFTGVRVCLTAVKGLAEAHSKPALGVSNLRALASFGARAARAVWIDARRGEIYGGVYDADLRAVSPEVVCPYGDWARTLPADAEIIHEPRLLAGAIGLIAAREGGVDPAAIDANYLRRSDAELFWKDA